VHSDRPKGCSKHSPTRARNAPNRPELSIAGRYPWRGRDVSSWITSYWKDDDSSDRDRCDTGSARFGPTRRGHFFCVPEETVVRTRGAGSVAANGPVCPPVRKIRWRHFRLVRRGDRRRTDSYQDLVRPWHRDSLSPFQFERIQ
jgi:hypothetical protein